MNFDRIAINNLENLSNLSKDKYINIINKLTIDIVDKEEKYENLTDVSDLEFAIYFTFHHILTSNNNRFILKKYSRKQILNMIDDSIENLYLKFGRPKSKDDCENKRFYYILEEIENLSIKAFDNLNYYNCYYLVNDWFYDLCLGFKVCHNISMDMNNILHGYINKNTNDFSESESESESENIKFVEPQTPPPPQEQTSYSIYSYFFSGDSKDE